MKYIMELGTYILVEKKKSPSSDRSGLFSKSGIVILFSICSQRLSALARRLGVPPCSVVPFYSTGIRLFHILHTY